MFLRIFQHNLSMIVVLLCLGIADCSTSKYRGFNSLSVEENQLFNCGLAQKPSFHLALFEGEKYLLITSELVSQLAGKALSTGLVYFKSILPY